VKKPFRRESSSCWAAVRSERSRGMWPEGGGEGGREGRREGGRFNLCPLFVSDHLLPCLFTSFYGAFFIEQHAL
jgi:hypothetical protein